MSILLHKIRASKWPSSHQAVQSRPPRRITYRPVPGSWQRPLRPHWRESIFHVPDEVPWGTIYFITKGWQIGWGGTAHIERLHDSGHVVKSPKTNPYDPVEEERYRADMRTEAAIYERLGDCPHIPRLIDWDIDTCCLTMQYLEKGSLDTYVRATEDVDMDVRRRWTLQAAAALKALHAAGVIHSDVTPRNFMLDADLKLYISDFAGSSLDGADSTVAGGSKYQPPGWRWNRPPQVEDDIFALGSVMYFIMAGKEPYDGVEDEEVEALFKEGKFPDVSGLDCASTIQGCWDGSIKTAEQIEDSLSLAYSAGADESS